MTHHLRQRELHYSSIPPTPFELPATSSTMLTREALSLGGIAKSGNLVTGSNYGGGATMFGRKKDKAKKATKKIEGPLWEYMVRKGVIIDALQKLRYVAADTEVSGKPCVCISDI